MLKATRAAFEVIMLKNHQSKQYVVSTVIEEIFTVGVRCSSEHMRVLVKRCVCILILSSRTHKIMTGCMLCWYSGKTGGMAQAYFRCKIVYGKRLWKTSIQIGIWKVNRLLKKGGTFPQSLQTTQMFTTPGIN